MAFAHPILAIFAGLLATAAAFIAYRRRLRFSLFATILCVVALISLSLAAGMPSVLRPVPARVLIMVDQSASTRGAQYHDGQLIQELSRKYGATVKEFGKDGDETIFSPQDADAIVLFSDGQFDLPAYAPPVYPVIDPQLAASKDASISKLEFRSREVIATVKNNLADAAITFSTHPDNSRSLPSGVTSISDLIAMNTTRAAATIASDDLWPENNTMSIAASPALHTEKWWVGENAPSDFRAMSITNLPADVNAYLLASVIVLNRTMMNDLSIEQTNLLDNYVRNLGGALILASAERQPDFSPLSDFPPVPQRRWVILCDVSGSMAQREGDQTRLARATDAIKSLLLTLPPADPIDIGGFAADLSWWTSGKTMEQILQDHFAPPKVEPSGPTNLEAILRKLLAQPSQNLLSQILLITDAEAKFENMPSLIEALTNAHSSVRLLQIGGNASPNLDELTTKSGGKRLTAVAEMDWSKQLKALAAGAMSDPVIAIQTHVEFEGRRFPISSIRQSWLKQDAELLASAQINNQSHPAIAKWNIGGGVVCAITSDNRDLTIELASKLAASPRDPRFAVSIEQGEFIQIRIDAIENSRYINGAFLSARLGDGKVIDIPQTSPGQYSAKLSAPRQPTILTIQKDGRPIDRIAVDGRYAREFSNIGLNRENLQTLATQTGGRVIDPSKGDSFNILRTAPKDLSPILLNLAIIAIAALLCLWKLGRLS